MLLPDRHKEDQEVAHEGEFTVTSAIKDEDAIELIEREFANDDIEINLEEKETISRRNLNKSK